MSSTHETRPPSNPGLCILSAHDPELNGFAALLGDSRRRIVHGFDVCAQAVGIGVLASAVGTTRLLASAKPRAAIFVGTAGAYQGQSLEIGAVVLGHQLVLASSAVAQGRAGYPAPMPVRTSCSEALAAGLARALDQPTRRVDVATTLAVTTDDALGAVLCGAYSCAVEHLEAAAVGLACAELGVPLAVVLGIANRVGQHGRDEWQAHHLAAGRAAAELVCAWLARGAEGLRT
jgi:nucleoside phosphorylase